VQPLRQIAMPKLAGPWEPLLGAIVRAPKLEAYVETTLYAPADARVVLHRATMRVWLDGVFPPIGGEPSRRSPGTRVHGDRPGPPDQRVITESSES
jgi:hypothetical protein